MDLCLVDGVTNAVATYNVSVTGTGITPNDAGYAANTAAVAAVQAAIAAQTPAGATQGACGAPPTVVEPAVVVAPVEAATVPEAATVAAPEAATVPAAVSAGDGSQAPSVPMWALVMIAVGVLGAAGAGKQLVGARK